MTEAAPVRDIRLVPRISDTEGLPANTSPEIKDLSATSATIEGTRQEALALLGLIVMRRGKALPRMTFVKGQQADETG